jgi:hypothetical protein
LRLYELALVYVERPEVLGELLRRRRAVPPDLRE